jgi:hypothetical protein
MNICLSYIGKLPSYIIECIYQIRLFTNINIYLILNDTTSTFLEQLKIYNNVHLINYKDVVSQRFIECIKKNIEKIDIIESFKDREELFIRSIERFYILQNAITKYNLTDVFFMEIDNLIYDDPEIWLSEFKKNDLCFMFDNYDRFSSGVMFIKDDKSMIGMLNFFIEYINNSKDEHINEMHILSKYFYSKPTDIKIQILPTFWNDANMIEEPKKCFENYNSIFDAASLGIMLFGIDPFLYGNKNFQRNYTKEKWMFSYIDYTKYQVIWTKDDKNRNIPFIFTGRNWLRINNLHIHSKRLSRALSVQQMVILKTKLKKMNFISNI